MAIVFAGAAVTACADGEAPRADPATTDPTTTTAPAAAAVFPGEAWDIGQPDEHGLDPTALDALAAEAEMAASSCLVVVRDGVVVADHAWPGPAPGPPREAFSATKSFTSTLVGIAADEGLLDLDQPASDLLTEWAGTDSDAVTVHDLLSNVSGRHWDFATDYRDMAIGATDKTGFALGLGQDDPPGETWAYNNSAIQTLDDVLERATGAHPSDYAADVLLGPLGMADSHLARDPHGNALTFMGLSTTCLDLARLGHLMLNDGRWGEEQIVSAEYVDQATSPSSDITSAYGLLWWLNRPGTLVSPSAATTGTGHGGPAGEGQLLPGAPEDAFWALGFNDQVLAVLPSEGIVAARMGPKPPADAPFTYAELTTGVLEALDDR